MPIAKNDDFVEESFCCLCHHRDHSTYEKGDLGQIAEPGAAGWLYLLALAIVILFPIIYRMRGNTRFYGGKGVLSATSSL